MLPLVGLTGARNNVQNGTSFLEVQDGVLDGVGKIVTRMSELKGLGSQDPMKSSQDIESYNLEFRDLQRQLYDMSQMTFNGVSLFANYQVRKLVRLQKVFFVTHPLTIQ